MRYTFAQEIHAALKDAGNLRIPFVGCVMSRFKWCVMQAYAKEQELDVRPFRSFTVGPVVLVLDRRTARAKERAAHG